MLGLDGTDYGAQNAELFSPELFAELYVPFFKIQNEWVHRNTGWKTWLHTCGSVTRIIPQLVEAGVDILNPVQTSAAGMDPAWLKRAFGRQDRLLGRRGGHPAHPALRRPPRRWRPRCGSACGCWRREAASCSTPIHNVQQGTPPQNIAAAYDTAREAGRYPLA